MKQLAMLVLFVPVLGFGAFVPTGEFQGSLNEGFESFPAQLINTSGFGFYLAGIPCRMSHYAGSDMILFNGEGEWQPWPFRFDGTYGTMRSGSRALSVARTTVFEFEGGVRRFGMWIQSPDKSLNIMARNMLEEVIYDETDVIPAYTDKEYHWIGWESTQAIRSITITSNPLNVFRVVNMDDLTADPVPEPASMLAMALGLGVLARRRK